MMNRTRSFARSLALLAGLTVGVTVVAQDKQPGTGQPGQPPAMPTEPPPPMAAPRPAPVITAKDADVIAAANAICGSYQAPAGSMGEGSPALNFNAAIVNIEDLDNAVYFEVSRADSPFAAIRSGIITFFKQTVDGKSALVMRVLNTNHISPSFNDMTTGLYLVPEMFPLLKASSLTVNSDITLKNDGGVFTGSAARQPTLAEGSTYFSTDIRFGKGSVSWTDRGINADGKQTFGPAAGKSLAFAASKPAATVERRPNGLAIITMHPPTDANSPAAMPGQDVFAHYSGWFTSDGVRFDSSRMPGREPLRFQLPGSLISGFREGITGMRKGEVRRLVIPWELGYGENGSRRIPGKANLMFELEALAVVVPPPAAPSEDKKP